MQGVPEHSYRVRERTTACGAARRPTRIWLRAVPVLMFVLSACSGSSTPHTPGGDIAVSISPQRAGLTLGQKIVLSAATQDSAGVTWRVDPTGGSLDHATSGNGQPVSLTAPSVAGVYPLTATS